MCAVLSHTHTHLRLLFAWSFFSLACFLIRTEFWWRFWGSRECNKAVVRHCTKVSQKTKNTQSISRNKLPRKFQGNECLESRTWHTPVYDPSQYRFLGRPSYAAQTWSYASFVGIPFNGVRCRRLLLFYRMLFCDGNEARERGRRWWCREGEGGEEEEKKEGGDQQEEILKSKNTLCCWLEIWQEYCEFVLALGFRKSLRTLLLPL